MNQVNQSLRSTISGMPLSQLSQQPITPSFSTPTPQGFNLSYASFGRRLLAYFLDVIIFRVFTGVLGLYTGIFIYYLSSNPETIVKIVIKALPEWSKYLMDYLFYVLYATIFLSIYSTTPGKHLCRLKIMGENNQRISFVSLLLRSLLQPFSLY